jgi:hypothetical protein
MVARRKEAAPISGVLTRSGPGGVKGVGLGAVSDPFPQYTGHAKRDTGMGSRVGLEMGAKLLLLYLNLQIERFCGNGYPERVWVSDYSRTGFRYLGSCNGNRGRL